MAPYESLTKATWYTTGSDSFKILLYVIIQYGVREPQAFDISPTPSPPLIRPLVPVSWLTLNSYWVFPWRTAVVTSLCMLILTMKFDSLSWSVCAAGLAV